jgi:hypothetical protein
MAASLSILRRVLLVQEYLPTHLLMPVHALVPAHQILVVLVSIRHTFSVIGRRRDYATTLPGGVVKVCGPNTSWIVSAIVTALTFGACLAHHHP